MSAEKLLFKRTERIKAGAGAAGLIAMGATGFGLNSAVVVAAAAAAAVVAVRLTIVSDREAILETQAGRESVMSDASDV